jgi:hypothetical protein
MCYFLFALFLCVLSCDLFSVLLLQAVREEVQAKKIFTRLQTAYETFKDMS